MKRFFENKSTHEKEETASKNERGSTMVEYVFLVALISLGCLTVITLMQVGINDKLNDAAIALGQGGGND
ncbi:MAG TPA: Flp family type IVb pilin [Oligoflexia bacterium]|nr:Flp family type IVb pilin [Oligoflexia bacterium]HMP48987.1 Flp family type IVb pilin [Oligoflexia bacterium]